MEELLPCACGRIWQLGHHEPQSTRRGTIKCRCSAVLAADADGSRDAYLKYPRDRAILLRKLLGLSGMTLLRVGQTLRIPLWRWLKPSRVSRLLAPNKAVHVRWEFRSGPS